MMDFVDNHNDICDKIDDIKSIVIKYLPESCSTRQRCDLLFDIFALREELSKRILELRDERNLRLKEIGKENSLVRQIIDLALLSNGMLKGKNLSDFIQRSISLIGTKE